MSYLYIGIICSDDSRAYLYVWATMCSSAVDAITRRAVTGVPGESDRMASGDDRRLASEFHTASNPLRKAETQAAAQSHANCEQSLHRSTLMSVPGRVKLSSVRCSDTNPASHQRENRCRFMIALSTRGLHPLGGNGNIMCGGIHEESSYFSGLPWRDGIARCEQFPSRHQLVGLNVLPLPVWPLNPLDCPPRSR